MTKMTEIRVPDIGDFNDVPIVEIPVAVGDTIAEGDAIILLESDKATMDVPSSHAGRVVEVKVAAGDRVSAGDLVLMIEAEIAEVDPKANAAPEPAAPAPPVADTATQPPPPVATPRADQVIPAQTALPVHASPSLRRFARSLGVAVSEVTGTGPNGRITREDIEGFVKSRPSAPAPAAGATLQGLPDWPKLDFSKFGEVERQPLGRIAKLSGPALARNSLVIPHVCNFDEADITALEAFRKQLNADAGPDQARLTMLAFTVKAVVAALKAYPRFNSSLDGDAIIVKKYWNIGVAADTPDGLVVPVIKSADRKGLREIAGEMASLAAQARDGRLRSEDMQGAGFTISSLGGIGGTNFTPIINAPEVAILGMTRAQIRPVWDGSAFQPRLVQPLSLSWDHRVVDGLAAARFLGHIAASLSDFRRISI